MSTPEERAAQKAQAQADIERAKAIVEELERAEEEERKRAEEEERKRVEEEARKKCEEEEKRRQEAEEQRVRDEEDKRKREVEEERLRKLADFKRSEAAALARLNEQAKAARKEKAARKALQEKGIEEDKGKKRARSGSESESGTEDEDEGGGVIIGGMVEKDGVTWKADDNRICYPCGKAHRRCLWREDGAKRAKACYHCNESRKKCTMTEESDTSEAKPPRKKRAAVGKGKMKVEAEPVASGLGTNSGSELGLGDVLERLLVEIQGLRNDLRIGFRDVQRELGEIRRNGRSVTLDARDLANHFMPENVVQLVGVEDDEAGKEAENEVGSETEKDTEMADETQQ